VGTVARYGTVAGVVAAAFVAVASSPSVARSTEASAGTLTVRVRDGVALALPGATVTAKAALGGRVVKVTADRDGVAAIAGLPEGSYRIDAAFPDFDVSRTTVRVGADGMSIDMRLQVRMLCECVDVRLPIQPAVVVQGRVVDEMGQPLPHAVVHAVGAGFNEDGVTDSDGVFEARAPRDRTLELVAAYPGFRSETVSVSTARPVSQRLSIVLRPATAQPSPRLGALERLRTGCDCPGNLFVHKIR
jgi:Carboxypeptidase regulatory-like domain